MNLEKENQLINAFRIIAAIFVIFAHAYALNNKPAPFFIDYGGLAVAFFFFVSGLYIAKSLKNEKYRKFGNFFKNRCYRILPSLLITVLITVFVMGPCMTTLSVQNYFLHKKTWCYLLNGIMILQHQLPGVFENNQAMATVNGSLWTLPVEFVLYIFVWCMNYFKLMKENLMKIWFVLSIIVYIGALTFVSNIVIQNALKAVMFFWMGTITFVLKKYIKVNPVMVAICIISIVIIISAPINIKCYNFIIVLTLPYLMICLFYGQRHLKTIPLLDRLGKKYSYAAYLCGFPIQQCLISINNGIMKPESNFVVSAIGAMVLGMGVYYLSDIIVKKML